MNFEDGLLRSKFTVTSSAPGTIDAMMPVA